MQSRRARAAAALAIAALLTSCSGDATPTPDREPSSSSASAGAAPATEAPLDEATAEAAAFAALSETQQDERLANDSLAAESALFADSQLAEDLGGAEKAADAYASVAGALVAAARAYQADGGVGRFGARPVAADDAGFGGMTFAGWLVAGMGIEGAVTATNDLKDGKSDSITKKDTFEGGSSELTLSGSVESASLDWMLVSTKQGMTGKVRVTGKVNPCPNANGEFSGAVTIATSGGGKAGTSTTVDVELTGQVDDDARITGYETSSHNRASSGGRGAVADVTSTSRYDANGVTSVEAGANQAGGATAEEGAAWGQLGMVSEVMITRGLVAAVTKGIESGRCVDLQATTNPTSRKGLKPSTSVSISAQPRSRLDGSPTGGTVTGQLKGDSALEPVSTKVPADATFTYVAPDKEDERAMVSLEARSRRGVGKADLDFDTVVERGYSIGERVTPYLFYGVSCTGPAGPWVITYEIEDVPQLTGGGTIKLTFPRAPTDEPGDAVTTEGTEKGELKVVGYPGGVRYGGSAKATLEKAGGVYRITITTQGSATGYAPKRQATKDTKAETFALRATRASANQCPTQ